VKKTSSGPKTNYLVDGSASRYAQPVDSVNEKAVRAKIAAELRAQVGQYKNATQQMVVEDMAQTVEYFGAHSYVTEPASAMTPQYVPEPAPSLHQSQAAATTASPAYRVEEAEYETPWRKLQVLDGAVILLYLGAFFVLASIGLYVGLGAGTTIKALLVTLLTIIFYTGGMALFTHSKRLKPAGMAFVAIGMATLPMAGAAVYYYGLNKTNGGMVWSTTSVIAILLYAHAMYRLRSTFVSYMVVFSSLSVALSSITVLGLAPYYFIQAMGFAGVLFVVISRLLNQTDYGIREAYERSAMFLVPFSVGMSVLFVARVGWLQLSLSLFVGAGYYAYVWLSSAVYRVTYSSLAQVIGVAAILTGLYGISEDAKVVAVGSTVLAFVYMSAWLLWARIRSISDPYRIQIKILTLCLPLIAIVAFLQSPELLWASVALTALTSAVVYGHDRDGWSGIGWTAGVLALPALVGFLTLDTDPALSTIGLWYLGITALSVGFKLALDGSMRGADTVWQQVVLFFALTIAAGMQYGADNTIQLFVATVQVALLVLQSLRVPNQAAWLTTAALVQLAWISACIDDARLLTGYVAGIFAVNLALAQVKGKSVLHDWLAGFAALSLPVFYGLLVASPDWSMRAFFISYACLFSIFIGLRYMQKLINISVSSTVYLFALLTALVLSYFVGPLFGLVVSSIGIVVFLGVDKLENANALGYVAPLLTLGIFFHQDQTARLGFIGLAVATLVSLIIAGFRKRHYEIFLAVIGLLLLPWHAGTVIFDWNETVLCSVYLGISAVLIIKRQYFKSFASLSAFTPALQTGYIAALAIGVLYATTGSWQLLSTALFAAGLILTAVSYMEDSPVTIIGAFIFGYLSILRLTFGLDLSLTESVAIFIGLSQGTYWILRASGLDTARAAYARGFQLAVAVFIPFVGLGRGDQPIYPASLALFSGMLAKEVWVKSQGNREFSLLVLHSSILWFAYTLGVREVQVYSQSTALVIALFALWRRHREDTPSVINSYLWMSVLTFTIPMVWQAIASANVAYAYLVLFEHTLLIVVSIIYKRATFAWWGIAVVVASVLYQLRKLRYAALAFLGVFIISLAVYFLLRYNKPNDQIEKSK